MKHPDFDLNNTDRNDILKAVRDFTDLLYNHIENSKGYNAPDPLHPSPGNLLNPEEEDTYANLLTFIDKHLNSSGINAASGRHLGYIPGGGLLESAIGNYIASIANYYSGVSYAAPVAVEIENSLIQWAGKLMGYPNGFLGNIASGGSIAHLTAMHAAKNAMEIDAANIRSHSIYFSAETHHSIHKALKITGLNECHIRTIPIDKSYCLDTYKLKEQIEADIQNGIQPFLIVSNAGSTNSGAVDDIAFVSDLAKKHKIWHHVDAAYGGFLNLTKRGRELFKGINKSDSMILDPHKGLFQSYGLGIVLVKNGKHLHNAFTEHADYMRDAETDQPLSPADLSIELTRPFRGLGMWMALKIHGVDKFTRALDQKLDLADMFYRRIKELGFETGPKPQLTVVLFRLKNDQLNTQLINDIHKNCPVFISSTNYGEKLWLRIAVLSHRTTQVHLDELIDFILDWKNKNGGL